MDMYDEAVVLVCFSDHGHASEIKEELHGCLLILEVKHFVLDNSFVSNE